MNETTAQTLTAPSSTEKSWLAVYADLIKARLTLLVLLTTLVGFYLGWRGPVDYLLMLHTVLGTALVASGAAALNQLLEREYDAKMRRTRNRPLPSGRLQPATVMVFGGVCACAGLVLPRSGSESDYERDRGGVAGQLSVHLHAAQAGDLAEHGRRRDSRRAAAADGLDGGARRTRAAKAGRCSPSWRSGNCRIFSPSPGCIATNTRRPGSRCCR